MAALIGASPGVRTEIDSTAAHLADGRDRLIARAAEIAEQIAGSVPLIYGCELDRSRSPIAGSAR